VSYKTSSKIVKKFVAEHGDPSVIEVRKQFLTANEARFWESEVLSRLRVTKSKKWLNAHDSRAFDPNTVPRGDKHWTKQDTEAAAKWRNREGWKIKSKSGVDMPKGSDHWTSKNTDAAKKHRDRMSGESNPNNSSTVKKKKSDYLKINNPVFKEDVREKIRKSLLGKKRPRKICEHCNKNIADSIYTKYHGLKCRVAPKI
jgi:hypothetical protein